MYKNIFSANFSLIIKIWPQTKYHVFPLKKITGYYDNYKKTRSSSNRIILKITKPQLKLFLTQRKTKWGDNNLKIASFQDNIKYYFVYFWFLFFDLKAALEYAKKGSNFMRYWHLLYSIKRRLNLLLDSWLIYIIWIIPIFVYVRPYNSCNYNIANITLIILNLFQWALSLKIILTLN